QFGKATAGFNHTGSKKEHQQTVTNSLESSVDVLNYCPHLAAFEVLWAGADERPEFCELIVPGSKGRIEIVYDPVSASYLPHLLSHPRPLISAAGGCFACGPISR